MKIGSSWAKDGMRKWGVILSQAIDVLMCRGNGKIAWSPFWVMSQFFYFLGACADVRDPTAVFRIMDSLMRNAEREALDED